MKRILTAVAFSVAIIGAGSAFAQQQTALLNSQIPLRGAGVGKTMDLNTTRYIHFEQTDPYIIDADGQRVSGSLSLDKLQRMPLWKNYVAITPFIYINTGWARFECTAATNWFTVIHWAGKAPETNYDNCTLLNKILSQSDTNW